MVFSRVKHSEGSVEECSRLSRRLLGGVTQWLEDYGFLCDESEVPSGMLC